MNERSTLLLSALLLVFGLAACDSFVEDVDNPITDTTDESLTDESQIGFLINGVQARFATAHDFNTLSSDLLSDQMVFGENGQATFPTYLFLDEGTMQRDNNSVDNAFNLLGEYRLLADTLLTRIENIGEFENPENEREARYIANLHGGIARYFFAAYYGILPQEGGSPIDNSEVIATSELYDRADAKLATALDFVGEGDGEYRTRLINSIRARIAIFRPNPDFDAARSYAEEGLMSGDDAYQSLHTVFSSNEWWNQAGRGRAQAVAAGRFVEYVEENPEEGYVLEPAACFPLSDTGGGIPSQPIESEERLPLYQIPLGRTEEGVCLTEPQQDLYPEQGSPIDFITWQSNSLVLAELDIRAGDFDSAVEHINDVRTSHGDLGPVDEDFADDGIDQADGDDDTDQSIEALLVEERDKELFAMGIRLVDQRRFSDDDDFPLGLYESEGGHLPDGVWRYLPVTEQECNANPNIQVPEECPPATTVLP